MLDRPSAVPTAERPAMAGESADEGKSARSTPGSTAPFGGRPVGDGRDPALVVGTVTPRRGQ